MNKVFIKLYVPLIENNYEMFIPIDKEICDIIKLLVRAINELVDTDYSLTSETGLYNRVTGEKYDSKVKICDTDIKNGMNLILV
ncbi:MAG: hypothetical protein PHD02_02590 [Bacilli bacterium]|nr:hypothetical protein [Bacilli bacterium]